MASMPVPKQPSTRRARPRARFCVLAAGLVALAVVVDLLNGWPHYTIAIPLYSLLGIIAFENPPVAIGIAAVWLGLGWMVWRLCRCGT